MSLAIERPETSDGSTADAPVASATTRLYRAVWRWHFYAGLFVSPFLVILAVSGIIYLFKPQLDALMYPLHVAPSGVTLPATTQLQAALDTYPGATASSFTTAEGPDRSAIVTLSTADERTRAVFVNPLPARCWALAMRTITFRRGRCGSTASR
jgi:uncharacterized iron-regulated membrane protein